MKGITSPLLLIFVLFTLVSCKKETLDSDSLEGSWQYSSVRHTGVNTDTTTVQAGIFTFRKSTESVNVGGTAYGESIAGTGEFPASISRVNVFLSKNTADFKLSESGEPSNYNYKNFYNGVYLYNFPNSSQKSYDWMRLCMTSKNELVIRLQNSQKAPGNSVPYDVRTMVLKRM